LRAIAGRLLLAATVTAAIGIPGIAAAAVGTAIAWTPCPQERPHTLHHADTEFDAAGDLRTQGQSYERITVDHRGVVNPEATEAQLFGPYGEVFHAGACGYHNAGTHDAS
jgi:hypothetical protein